MTDGADNLRVLQIYRTYFPDTQGGGEEVIRQICHNTRSLGVESRVYTLSPRPAGAPLARPEAEVHQVRRHLEPASCSISLTGMATFRRQAAWADVLHYHFPWPFGDVLHLLNRGVTDKPTVVTYHSDIVRQRGLNRLYQPLMRHFLARVDRIVATSPTYASNSALLQQYRDKVAVIPIGIDEAELPTPDPAKVADIKQRHGDSFFFFVGVLRYYKGLKYLLEAARLTGATIVIAGSGPDEEALKAFKAQHRLDNVHFVGRVSDREKMSYLAACRALVFPSHLPSEAFGISLLEASLSHKPMICCEIGTGTSYVNIDGETGLVVPPAAPQPLAEAMDKLAADSSLAQSLGAAARARYEYLFTGQAMGRQYARLYRELVPGTAA